MRITINKITSVLLVVLSLGGVFSSCVKDRNDVIPDLTNHSGIIELLAGGATTSGNPARFKAFGFSVTDSSQNVGVYVNYADSKVAPADITVNVALDPATLTDYNAANGTSYAVLDPAAYELTSTSVTIKKGERFAILPIRINPDKIDLNTPSAIPLKITDAGGTTVSANYNYIIYSIVGKNQYDGEYEVTGWFFHPAAGRELGASKSIFTVSVVRSEGSVGDLGSPFQFDVVDGKVVNATSDDFASFDLMTADNPGGVDYSDPSNGGHVPGDAEFNKDIYNNTYDSTTKTFYFHYGYTNAAAGASQSAFTRQIYEKWVRKE